MATHFILGAELGASACALYPRVPRWEHKSEGLKWGPGSVTTHLRLPLRAAPEQSSRAVLLMPDRLGGGWRAGGSRALAAVG